MKLQLKCDRCGKLGTADEILSDYDRRDLCYTCGLKENLGYLKQQYNDKRKWLEATHLKNLQELEIKIVEIERKLSNNSGARGQSVSVLYNG